MNDRITGLPATSNPSGDQFKVIAGSHTFGGRVLLAEILTRRGSEPPLRRHRHEDLLMYVLDGRLTFQVDGQRRPASPGSCVVVPRGCAHGFIVESETAHLLLMLTPAGAEEHLAQLFGSPGMRGASSPSGSCEIVDRLVTTAARYDIDITGPPP